MNTRRRRDLFTPLEYEFFVRGLVVSTLVGGLCGLIGVYIVLRRMAYIGHGLSHAIFGGAVVSYLMSINFLVGASVWGFVSALLINLTTRHRRIGADAAIGIVTTASFALGVALISRFKGFTRSFDAALFGNILGVSDGDVIAVTVVALVAAVAVFVGYKHLLFATFEPEVSRFYGVPSGWVDAGLGDRARIRHSRLASGLGRDDARSRDRHPTRRRPAADERLQQDARRLRGHRRLLRTRGPLR